MSPKKKRPTFSSDRRRIALIVESSLASGRAMLRGIAEYVRQAGPWSIYYEPGHFHTVLPDWLAKWRGDGVIARIRNRAIANHFVKAGLPVVDVLGNVPDTGIPVVQVDNQAIAQLAVSHLVEHGFRSFAFCGVRGPLWSQQRRDIFKEIITKANYVSHFYQLPRMDSKNWFSETERERLALWINGLPKPIGIMAANDWAGQKVLEACRRVGTLVPEEVSVIGVDNDDAICGISDPMLSSIIAQHDRVGFHAAELLDQLMRGKPRPSEPLIVGIPSIAVRQSTDVQTIADEDVVAALRFIRENACLDVTVDDVAAHVAMSYSTLKRRFQQVLSRSVHEEMMRVRMERVRELLVETQMPLAQIARVTGFRHQEYLGVVFKARNGMTPMAFRRNTGLSRAAGAGEQPAID